MKKEENTEASRIDEASEYMELAKGSIPEGGEPYYRYSRLDVTLIPLRYHEREFECYVKASELGNADATVFVGLAYRQGYPVGRNYCKAFDCFARAVELGDEYLAPFLIAECYEQGLGTDIDENAAVLYYTMSAERGNISSMLALARIYSEGLYSIEKDKQKAAKYYFMSGIGRD